MTRDYAYQRIETSLRDAISGNALKPGEKLPSLRAMSARHGVSLNTALKAYEELERQGFIQARPRSGFFVRQTAELPQPSLPPTQPAALRPESVSRSSLIREVLSAMGSGDLLSMGLSLPDAQLLPNATLTRIMSQVMRDKNARALDYSPVAGLPELRRHVAGLVQAGGARVSPDDVIVTGGAVEALSIALRCTTRPGDAVAIPTPTYYCLLELMETLGLRAVELPSCPVNGLDPADLDRALARFDARAVVLIPNFNNPDASLMPDDAKADVAALAAKHRVPIIEDDVYGELIFDGPRPPLLQSFAEAAGAEVLTCGSFSKTVSPGFRVGWLTPGKRMAQALKIKTTTNVCTPTPLQATVAEFIRRGHHARQVQSLRRAVARQSRLMRAAVARHFPPQTAVTDPKGGMQLWLKLPEGVDAVAYFLAAREAGIGVCPGTIFSPSDRFGDCVRLSCGTVWTDAMEDAFATLGSLARQLA